MVIKMKSGHTNCYLLSKENSQKVILIDAGISSDHLFIEHLRATGYLSKISLLILTHGHYDHVGNAAILQDHFHIPVAIHRGDLNKVTHGAMDFPPAKGFLSNFIRNSTLNEMNEAYYQQFTPDIVLDNQNALLDFPEIEIVHLPGHTKGSIGVIFENNLFAGDLVMNMPIPSKSPFAEDFSELKCSIDFISNFGFRRIYAGHGQSFSGKWLNHLL